MNFIDIPVERSTAITDLILGVFSVYLMLFVLQFGYHRDRVKAQIWAVIFGLLAVASLLGTVAHGFKMSIQTNHLIWQPLNLSLGLMVALIAVSTVYALKGRVSRFIPPIFIATGLLFYLFTVFKSGTFLVFIVYEASVMLFTLGTYIVLLIKQKIQGSQWMVIGFLLTIAAAVVQASGPIQTRFIWDFDHNGLFHLIQIVGLIFVKRGLKAAFIQKGNESKIKPVAEEELGRIPRNY